MNMVLIPPDQISYMSEIMDTLLKDPTLTVRDIKERFNLTTAEYNMIFDLTMPMLREANIKKYWCLKYKYISRKIKELLANENIKDKKFRDRIKELIIAQSIGEVQMTEAVGPIDEKERVHVE